MRYCKVRNGIGLPKSPILGHHSPLEIKRGLNEFNFATTDKTVSEAFIFSICWEPTSESDIPFWAQSISDCAEEVLQGPESTKS